MDTVIVILILSNLLLGTALIVAMLAQLDQRHAARLREEERQNPKLKRRRWD